MIAVIASDSQVGRLNIAGEIIERIHKILAVRYHPDNPETGNIDQFLMLNRAYETLTDEEARAAYHAVFQRHDVEPISLFEPREFAAGVDGKRIAGWASCARCITGVEPIQTIQAYRSSILKR